MKSKKILFVFFVFILFCCTQQKSISSPILTEPPKDDDIVDSTPEFGWNTESGAISYSLEISSQSDFTPITITGITKNSYALTEGLINFNTTYYWRVKSIFAQGEGDWSDYSNFKTISTPLYAVNSLTVKINAAIANNDISQIQGNILKSYMNNVQTSLLNNQLSYAVSYTNTFKNHVQVLLNSRLINNVKGNRFIKYGKALLKVIPVDNSPILIGDDEDEEIAEFTLNQNYPNPFNPETYISYRINKVSHVSINVYDTQGKLVRVLINEQKEAGNYLVRLDGSNLSSGIYFYKLIVGNYTETRKMMLSK